MNRRNSAIEATRRDMGWVDRPEPEEGVLDPHDQFLKLLEPERDALWRFALRMCWDRGSAEDCLQEAVMTAYRKFSDFTPGTSFRAWTFRILSNVVLNSNSQTRRRLQRHVSSESLDMIEALEREEAYGHVLADPSRLLDQVSDPIKRAVRGLPPHERMVFLLRAAEGFRYKEIAQILDIPMGTVMSHLFRARARLRETLADFARETGFVRNDTP